MEGGFRWVEMFVFRAIPFEWGWNRVSCTLLWQDGCYPPAHLPLPPLLCKVSPVHQVNLSHKASLSLLPRLLDDNLFRPLPSLQGK